MLDRVSTDLRRVSRFLGMAGFGLAAPVFQRAAGLRPHVLHGRSPDACGPRRRPAHTRERARLLHGRCIPRPGIWAVHGRLDGRISGAPAHTRVVCGEPAYRRRERHARALDQPQRKRAEHQDRAELVSISELLKMRGFPAVMVSSVVTITALDLLVIYLPLLGAERQIDANHIGLLLTVRSMAALISRVFYARLIFGMGRAPLTLASMLASAGAFLVLALSLSLPAMYAILIALGFAIGIAPTLTISGVVHLAPPQAYGTALTLRMTGNRVGQIVFPAVAGLLAAATGVGGILVAIGLGLAVSGIAVAVRQPPASAV